MPKGSGQPQLQTLKQEKEALLRVGGGQTQLDLNPVDQGSGRESLRAPTRPGAGAVRPQLARALGPA